MFGWLKKLKNQARQSLEDPVCGMQASAGITTEYQGQTYGFCSDHCREQFEKTPERFAKK